ncbi:MAG: hypothetical protein E7228_04820 [Clostridiales bacterium]|nr:hypothetical protein [Clostridiales bacterium]
MATFTNFATLSYNGGTTTSNIVTGELLETLSATKTAVSNDYTAKDDVTYVVSLVNSGPSAITGLTVSDDLGGYAFDEGTIYPLEYTDGSIRYYINGVLQTAPTVAAGPPLEITGINVPAGGNVILIYEAAVTNYAPLATDASITNTVTVSGGGLSSPITAEETIFTENRADLTVNKAISPSSVTENGQLSYTFIIENQGNTEAAATDNVILTDTFDPILDPITVTYNGVPWTEGVNYTYDETTGEFASLPGQITVPAASYIQNDDGTWTVLPGTSVLVITGTV